MSSFSSSSSSSSTSSSSSASPLRVPPRVPRSPFSSIRLLETQFQDSQTSSPSLHSPSPSFGSRVAPAVRASSNPDVTNDEAIARAHADDDEDLKLESDDINDSEFYPSDEGDDEAEQFQKTSNENVDVSNNKKTKLIDQGKASKKPRGKIKKQKMVADSDINEDRKRFSKEEDLVLVQCYLNVSEDSVVGTNQSGSTMWDRITENFASFLIKMPIGHRTLRTPISYKSRYHGIQTDTVKFLSYRNNCGASGDNQVTIHQKAHTLFEDSFSPPRKFLYDHCLDLMESSEKIRSLIVSSAASSPDQFSTANSPTSDSNNSLASARPQGRDTSKRDRAAERQRSKERHSTITADSTSQRSSNIYGEAS